MCRRDGPVSLSARATDDTRKAFTRYGLWTALVNGNAPAVRHSVENSVSSDLRRSGAIIGEGFSRRKQNNAFYFIILFYIHFHFYFNCFSQIVYYAALMLLLLYKLYKFLFMMLMMIINVFTLFNSDRDSNNNFSTESWQLSSSPIIVSTLLLQEERTRITNDVYG